MKTYKEILNNKSTQQIRLITIHNILNDIDMNLLTEKAKQIFIKQNIQIEIFPNGRNVLFCLGTFVYTDAIILRAFPAKGVSL